MNPYKSNLLPARMSAVLGVILATTLAWPAAAGTLRVDAQRAPTATVTAGAGGFAFTIRNDGAGALDHIRVLADRAHPVVCAHNTQRGRAFAGNGALQAGDSVACSGRSLAPLRQRDATVVVAAREADGTLRQRTARFMLAPAATPDQGIVALLGGGVHIDGNGDGLLDAGEVIDYHYTVLNLGTLALTGLAVDDIDGAVTCPSAGLAVGGSMVCTGQHLVSAAEATDGFVLNDVQVLGTATDGSPVQASDMVLRMDLGGSADVRALKSPLLGDDADGSGYASAGDRIDYTFVIKNSGGQALTAVDLVEPDPSLIDAPISCAATSLAGQPFSGLGTGSLAASDAVLCQASHVITPAEASAGVAENLAEVSGQPGVGGPVSGAAASAVVIPLPASVALTKALLSESGSLPGIAEPGEMLTYGIRLVNSGGADALNVAVVDPLDPNVVFVSADHGGMLAGGNVAWSGLVVPGGGQLDLTVVVSVLDPIPVGTLAIANLAYEPGSIPPDCSAVPMPAACVVTPTPGSVSIAKALVSESGSQPGIAEPGEMLGYAITLTNAGGSAVTGYALSDPLDPHVNFISADNGGVHAGGTVTWTNLTIPAGGSLSVAVVVQVVDPVPVGVVQIVNLAHESATPPVDCSLVPRPQACVVTPVAEAPRLQVTKVASSGSTVPGGTVTYTITVANVGPVVANNVVVADPLPAGISAFAWTCSAAGGAACAHASGSGAISEVIPAFPPGGSLTFVVTASVAVDAQGSLLNLVSVEPSDATICMPQELPAPCAAAATVVVGAVALPTRVPVDNPLALLLLVLGVLGVAGHFVARQA